MFPDAKTPLRATPGSAGVDLYAYIGDDDGHSIVIAPQKQVSIHTGIAVEIPEGYGGFIYARSSIATQHNITLINSVAVIDNDYRGEIVVHMVNLGDTKYTINDGDRFAQLIITAMPTFEISVADELTPTQRGIKGFGSTGV